MTTYIQGKKYEWEYTIGLEVHAQITTNSKIFSSASTKFGSPPNSQVNYVDAAFPGMLPVLNKACISQAVKTGIALNADINLFSRFDRKNYFYPDLPAGYQISQFYMPIVKNGWINIIDSDQKMKKIKIERLHLEQDAGKSIHDYYPNYSCIDLNRAGIPLMEIVTAPDIKSPYQAAEYVRKLKQILTYIQSCDGNMERGSLRCDANVSVKPRDSKEMGNRCEIKNLNSIKSISKAIEFEAKRQVAILENGGKIISQTLSFDEKSGTTAPIRLKESSSDYKYFPEPDLPPVQITEEYVNTIKAKMPELPDQKIERYTKQYSISLDDALNLTNDKLVAVYFDQLISFNANPQLCANWMLSAIFSTLNEQNIQIDQINISPERLAKLVLLIQNDTISNKAAKLIFSSMLIEQNEPIDIAKKLDLIQISDINTIKEFIDKVCKNNQSLIQKYQNGEVKVLNNIMAQIFKETKGKANPKIVKEQLIKKLS